AGGAGPRSAEERRMRRSPAFSAMRAVLIEIGRGGRPCGEDLAGGPSGARVPVRLPRAAAFAPAALLRPRGGSRNTRSGRPAHRTATSGAADPAGGQSPLPGVGVVFWICIRNSAFDLVCFILSS